jgi:uncharacterized protein DUF11
MRPLAQARSFMHLHSTRADRRPRARWLSLRLVPIAVVLAGAAVPVGQASADQLSPHTIVQDTDVVSAGVGGMNFRAGGTGGTGSITVAGVSGTVTQALLYWAGPTDSTNPAANALVTFADTPVTGINIGFSDSNCWGPPNPGEFVNSQAYRADVTSLVTGNGTYALTNFSKPDSPGSDVNGASLIVFFDDGVPTNDVDVIVVDGNDSNFPNGFDPDGWDATIEGVTNFPSEGPADLVLHVADGQPQYPDDALLLNEQELAPADSTFAGDTVPNPTEGEGLWDIVSFEIGGFMSPGANTLNLTSGLNQDCIALVAATLSVPAGSTGTEPTGEADLSIDKSDTPDPESGDTSFGPDPVGSKDIVVYKVTVSNAGPDPATGVTVTDTPSNGTVLANSGGPGWTCSIDSESNSATCTRAGPLAADASDGNLRIWVRAPGNGSSSSRTFTDTATVEANESDPVAANNTDIETTTVLGANSPQAKDQDATFCTGTTSCTVRTTRDTTGGFYSQIVVPAGFAGLLSIEEVPPNDPRVAGLCGGRNCDAQVQISVVPPGQTGERNPFKVTWFYVQGRDDDDDDDGKLYVKGDSEVVASVVANCLRKNVANPPKCVSSRTTLDNGDRKYVLLWRDGGDPHGGRR